MGGIVLGWTDCFSSGERRGVRGRVVGRGVRGVKGEGEWMRGVARKIDR